MESLAQLTLFSALAPEAHSQSVLYTFDDGSSNDWLGSSVSGVVDVNGDGFADMIVGAPNDVCAPSHAPFPSSWSLSS